MTEIYGSAARCISNCASPPRSSLCAGLGAGVEGEDSSSPVLWECSPQPLPDPETKSHQDGLQLQALLQGAHAASPSGMATSCCNAGSCPAWYFGDSPVPWLGHVENTLEVKSCETVHPDVLLVLARCKGASCIGAGLGHQQGLDAVSI